MISWPAHLFSYYGRHMPILFIFLHNHVILWFHLSIWVAASKLQGGVVVLCTAEACRVKCASFQGGHPGQSGSKLLPARIGTGSTNWRAFLLQRIPDDCISAVVSKVTVPFAGTASWPLLPRSAERKASRPMSMVDRPHPGAEQNGSHPNPNPFSPLELEGEASFHWDSDFAAMAVALASIPM